MVFLEVNLTGTPHISIFPIYSYLFILKPQILNDTRNSIDWWQLEAVKMLNPDYKSCSAVAKKRQKKNKKLCLLDVTGLNQSGAAKFD